jgi:adenine-specific DNA-methyltransferase
MDRLSAVMSHVLAADVQALLTETERRRIAVSRELDPEKRTQLGQFFTPASVADALAELAHFGTGHLRVLDPGAGIGSLTASLVGRLLIETDISVHVTAYEVDPVLQAPLRETLSTWTELSAGRMTFDQRSEDFLASVAAEVSDTLFSPPTTKTFDLVVMNPPYGKINATHPTREMLAAHGFQTTNLYTAFLAMGQRLVAPSGQLIAITPRSFFNGTYFRGFRKSFLNDLGLQAIHVFESRREAFAGDAVLQENVIFSAVKGNRPETITVTTSYGADDDMTVVRHVPRTEVVRPDDPESFIHVTADENQAEIARRMLALPASLSDLGLTVSTGKVVDFRATQWLATEAGPDTAPLIYQTHIRGGKTEWPVAGFRKPQHMCVTAESLNQFLPAGFYVITKRFTAKEERRRVTAAVVDPADVPGQLFGFENHTNVFHVRGGGIERELAQGLCIFLNSTLVDAYFRQFSGHTQVNSGDLRSLRYPSVEALVALGAAGGTALAEQDTIDALVSRYVPALGEGGDPLSAQKKIEQAQAVLRALEMPSEQLNERSALTLLALLNLRPEDPWSDATAPLRGITPMMDFFAAEYGKVYKPNTRETVRRQTVHQFVDSGLVLYNPDDPHRPVNSPRAVYQIEQSALLLIQQYGQSGWQAALDGYRSTVPSLQQRHAAERDMARIPVTLPSGREVTLSPGGQNTLIKDLVDGFCPRFVPGGQILYIGDADAKWAVNEDEAFADLGLTFDRHGKMPDLVVHDNDRNWLILVEAVTSHGPVNAKRHDELKALFAASTAGLVFVTAFLTRSALAPYLNDISWETEVWCADNPSHLIHFNGTRFLGPYSV